jgi:hypothetical protein
MPLAVTWLEGEAGQFAEALAGGAEDLHDGTLPGSSRKGKLLRVRPGSRL